MATTSTLGTTVLSLDLPPQYVEYINSSKLKNLAMHSSLRGEHKSLGPRIYCSSKAGSLESRLTKISGEGEPTSYDAKLCVPVIDLQGFEGGSRRRGEIIEEIGKAFETWGILNVVNHGIPMNVLNKVLESTREFHELPEEMKMEYNKNEVIMSSGKPDLISKRREQWRESISWEFEDDQFHVDGAPLVFRKAVEDYMSYLVKFIKNVFSELASEALGLERQHLASMGCLDDQRLSCNYYPPSPHDQPLLAQGKGIHTDPYFLTVGLQDHNAARQVFHENQWLDVAPVHDALDINAGDLLQTITNGKFKSPVHRVIAQQNSPRARVAAACFFLPSKSNDNEPSTPINEITC